MAFNVGDVLPPFTRDSGLAYWNRYAAVNDEFWPIHMDDEAGRAAGFPTAFGMGNLTSAYLHIALHQWFGETARIETITTQYRSAVTRGKQVVVRATVTAVRSVGDRETAIELDLRAEDDDGKLLAPSNATLVVPD
jgi:acyl dehydratase